MEGETSKAIFEQMIGEIKEKLLAWGLKDIKGKYNFQAPAGMIGFIGEAIFSISHSFILEGVGLFGLGRIKRKVNRYLVISAAKTLGEERLFVSVMSDVDDELKARLASIVGKYTLKFGYSGAIVSLL